MEHSQKWPGSQHAYSENSLFSSCKAVTRLSIIDFWFRKVLYSMLNFFLSTDFNMAKNMQLEYLLMFEFRA